MPSASHDIADLHRRILSRIARKYETVTVPLQVGPIDLLFTRVTDPDRVLDQVAEEEDRRERSEGKRRSDDELHLPYWAELWDSAMGIGQFLTRPAGQELLGESALDLGCGMGLAGTIAAALGTRVLFADLEPPALLFARLNSLPWRQRVRARQTNWRSDRLGETFSLIIGADILYERRQWEFLEPFWRQHLAPGGRLLLGEPGRQTGDLFPDWIAQQGWSLERFEEPVTTRPKPVRLFVLQQA